MSASARRAKVKNLLKNKKKKSVVSPALPAPISQLQLPLIQDQVTPNSTHPIHTPIQRMTLRASWSNWLKLLMNSVDQDDALSTYACIVTHMLFIVKSNLNILKHYQMCYYAKRDTCLTISGVPVYLTRWLICNLLSGELSHCFNSQRNCLAIDKD